MFIVLCTSQWHVKYLLKQGLTTFLLPSIFENGVPRVLIAKPKSNQSQGLEITILKVLHSCLISRYWWMGRCLRVKTSAFNPCNIICQLRSGLDSVGVWRLCFWKPSHTGPAIGPTSQPAPSGGPCGSCRPATLVGAPLCKQQGSLPSAVSETSRILPQQIATRLAMHFFSLLVDLKRKRKRMKPC